jgi:hypothetical protein
METVPSTRRQCLAQEAFHCRGVALVCGKTVSLLPQDVTKEPLGRKDLRRSSGFVAGSCISLHGVFDTRAKNEFGEW